MPDLMIQTTNLPDLNKIVAPNKPAYLVMMEVGKTIAKFIAVKMDEGARFVKCVGFFQSGSEENAVQNYATLIAERPTVDFIEMQFPYEKVVSVRSLVYRHKGGK